MSEAELIAAIGRDGIRAVASYLDEVAAVLAREAFVMSPSNLSRATGRHADGCAYIADMLRHIAEGESDER